MNRLAKILFAVFVLTGGAIFAQENTIDKECSVYTPAKHVVRTKGLGANPYMIPDTTFLLPRKATGAKGQGKKKNTCSFTIYNYNDQPIHMFIDSVYAGTIEANRAGVKQHVKEDASFYWISNDQDFSWDEIADCSCRLIFHLRIEKYKGDVILD